MTKTGEDRLLRILPIDGGGMIGASPAAFLAPLEESVGTGPIGRHFHLIVGTSTGGLITIGQR